MDRVPDVPTWCGHREYRFGHCAEMGCRNYAPGCLRHSVAGEADALCHQPALGDPHKVRIAGVTPLTLTTECACRTEGCMWQIRVPLDGLWRRLPPVAGTAAAQLLRGGS